MISTLPFYLINLLIFTFIFIYAKSLILYFHIFKISVIKHYWDVVTEKRKYF